MARNYTTHRWRSRFGRRFFSLRFVMLYGLQFANVVVQGLSLRLLHIAQIENGFF